MRNEINSRSFDEKRIYIKFHEIWLAQEADAKSWSNAKVETLVVVEVAAEGGLPAKFPSDFKWQKLALSAPLKPRKVAMHPRFTTPERLTPSYALVGGRGGEKILRY